MSIDEFKKLAREFMEAVVPTMDGAAISNWFAEDGYFLAQGKFADYRMLVGRAEIKGHFDALSRKVYTRGPARLQVEQMTGEGNRVVAEWKFYADTAAGPYQNVGATAIEFDQAGKIKALRQYLDTERVVNLLGMIDTARPDSR